jgi:hypothetical protein
MKPTELITENAINIVFENTNFGKITAREVVEENLIKVKQGWAIGHTAKCCLVELGLIYETSKKNLVATRVGDRYLEILINE